MTSSVSTRPVYTRPRPVPGEGPKPSIENEPELQSQAEPSVKPWTVVVGWAVLLAVLVAVSAGFGNSPIVLEISGGAVAIVLAVAGAVWLDHRFRPQTNVFRLPVRLGGPFLFAVAVTVAGLALAFGEFMLMLAVVPLAGAIGLEIAARHQARDRKITDRQTMDRQAMDRQTRAVATGGRGLR